MPAAYFKSPDLEVAVSGRAVYEVDQALREVERGKVAVALFTFDAVSPWDGPVEAPGRLGWPKTVFIVGDPVEVPKRTGRLEARLDWEEPREIFYRRVREAKKALDAGEVFQLVAARYRRYKFRGDPWPLLSALKRRVSAKYYYLVDLNGFFLVGASPETLVRVENGCAVSGPIGGTRPRGATPEEDTRLEQELINSVKDRAEHIMLVDSVRNDLGRVCRWGTVEVADMLRVEKYSHYQHLVSYIRCQLDRLYRPTDAVSALNPTTTVSGVPKPRALELLAQLEEPRGPFAGSVGVVTKDTLDFAVVIRSLYVEQDHAYVWAGAGIVTDSTEQNEWEETIVKMRPLVEILENDGSKTKP
ncbi:MAG: anthranilate synthase component I family protein [Pyrobaculum sp.]